MENYHSIPSRTIKFGIWFKINYINYKQEVAILITWMWGVLRSVLCPTLSHNSSFNLFIVLANFFCAQKDVATFLVENLALQQTILDAPSKSYGQESLFLLVPSAMLLLTYESNVWVRRRRSDGWSLHTAYDWNMAKVENLNHPITHLYYLHTFFAEKKISIFKNDDSFGEIKMQMLWH